MKAIDGAAPGVEALAVIFASPMAAALRSNPWTAGDVQWSRSRIGAVAATVYGDKDAARCAVNALLTELALRGDDQGQPVAELKAFIAEKADEEIKTMLRAADAGEFADLAVGYRRKNHVKNVAKAIELGRARVPSMWDLRDQRPADQREQRKAA